MTAPSNPYGGCTCMQPWMSILPPPPCPVHAPVHHCRCHHGHMGTSQFVSYTTNTIETVL